MAYVTETFSKQEIRVMKSHIAIIRLILLETPSLKKRAKRCRIKKLKAKLNQEVKDQKIEDKSKIRFGIQIRRS